MNLLELVSKLWAWLQRGAVEIVTSFSSHYRSIEYGEVASVIQFERGELYSEESVAKVLHPRYQTVEFHIFQPRHVYILTNGFLDTINGIAFDRNRNIVGESTPWPELYFDSRPITKPHKRCNKLTSKTIILAPSSGYYHWLIEELPNLIYLVENYPGAQVVLCKNSPTYAREFLTFQNIDFIETPRFIEFENLLTISKNDQVGWPHPTDISLLRKKFVGQFDPDSNLKIYISRLNSTRSPKFEKRLQQALSDTGWKILFLENLKLQEQIRIFQKAAVICGVHGAGLANQVWMPSGGKVVELGTNRYVNCFAILAKQLDHSYTRINYEEIFSSGLDALQKAIELAATGLSGEGI